MRFFTSEQEHMCPNSNAHTARLPVPETVPRLGASGSLCFGPGAAGSLPASLPAVPGVILPYPRRPPLAGSVCPLMFSHAANSSKPTTDAAFPDDVPLCDPPTALSHSTARSLRLQAAVQASCTCSPSRGLRSRALFSLLDTCRVTYPVETTVRWGNKTHVGFLTLVLLSGLPYVGSCLPLWDAELVLVCPETYSVHLIGEH